MIELLNKNYIYIYTFIYIYISIYSMIIDIFQSSDRFLRNFTLYNLILNKFYQLSNQVKSSLQNTNNKSKSTMSITEEIDDISDLIKKLN